MNDSGCPKPCVEGYDYEYWPSGGVLVKLRGSRVWLQPSVLKCVAFAAAKTTSGYKIGGTVFFINHRIEHHSHYAIYAVTARHVVEGALNRSVDAAVHVRLNARDAATCWLPFKASEWEFHDDERVDVGVAPTGWSDELVSRFDHKTISSTVFLTDELIDALQTTPGERLYFPGLFVRQPGNETNLPIIRTGTIAALAKEPISTPLGLTKLHLAEVRSIGGHSGSPVFIYPDSDKEFHFGMSRDDNSKFFEARSKNPALRANSMLGLIHGHFPIRPDDLVPTIGRDGNADWIEGVQDFNSGIAAIVPAAEILHVLNQPALVERRARDGEGHEKSSGGTVMD